MCDFAAILNAFRDHTETAHDNANANGDAIARSDTNACSALHEGRAHRPLPRAEFLEGARVSNAAAHICAAAAGFFCYTHTGRYPEYLYSYRYL